ncbi:DUF357 domain-containing protein [Candidatus Woesearchaeota archaeon]|nr:DUF357 domain-containing protein [Candidatus Woesearchaeota archaeon]
MRMVNNTLTEEHVQKYFKITGEAIEKVKTHELDIDRISQANDFLDMIERYYSDAKHFYEKGEWLLAFAALNYAHGWLDAGARSELFKVKDSRLFTVDDE